LKEISVSSAGALLLHDDTFINKVCRNGTNLVSEMPGTADNSPPPRRRRKTQAVTMSDVAAFADVSPSTVSLYLRKPEAVSPQTGRVIALAIAKLNYVPNFAAGSLAAAASRAVGVVVPSIKNAAFAETVMSLQTALGKANFHVLLGHTEYDEREEEAVVRTALSWAPAALVLTGLGHSEGTRKVLASRRIPVVEIFDISGDCIDIAVGFSHEKVGEAMADHLAETGHRRLAFIGSRMQEDLRAARRASAFVARTKALGLPPPPVIGHPAPPDAEIGGMLMSRLIESHPEVQAVACSNDHIALGALFCAQRRGLRVPDDIAIMGFGGLAFTLASTPPISTVLPHGDLIGKETARLIIERHGGKGVDRSTVVDTHFQVVPRESTAPRVAASAITGTI